VISGQYVHEALAISRSTAPDHPEAQDIRTFAASNPPEQLVDLDRVLGTLSMPHLAGPFLKAASKVSDDI